MEIRNARITDLEAIRGIYNEAVLNTTATFDTEEKTYENRLQWFTARDENFPVIVACENDEVTGYASLNRWSDKKAYDITAELSLYIAPRHRGKGVGSLLLRALLEKAQNTSLHSIIARITEGNAHSIHLHQKEGFELIGIQKSCGKKFGRVMDVTLMQKVLKP